MKKRCRLFSLIGIPGVFSIGYYEYEPETTEEGGERLENEFQDKQLLEEYNYLLTYDEEFDLNEAKCVIDALKLSCLYINHPLSIYKDLYGLYRVNKTRNIIYAPNNIIISSRLFEKIKKKSLSSRNILNNIIENINSKFFYTDKQFIYIAPSFIIYSAPINKNTCITTLNSESYILFGKDDKLNKKIEKESKKHKTYIENLIIEQSSIQEAKNIISNLRQQQTTPENFFLKCQLPKEHLIDDWLLRLGIYSLEQILLDAMEIQVQGNNLSCKFASSLISTVTSEKFSPEKLRSWYNKKKIPGIKIDKIYVSIAWILEYISEHINKDIFSPIQLLPYVKNKK